MRRRVAVNLTTFESNILIINEISMLIHKLRSPTVPAYIKRRKKGSFTILIKTTGKAGKKNTIE